ncbi:MAG TPA: NYN domain-containing protein [Gemmatimonadaceae bacterium]|nr:NYN domain-containing protein [Gemmatimonadaceae bacterium]
MNSRPQRSAPSSAHRQIAPVHRGPQAVPHTQLGAPVHHAPNAALLIDFDNVTMGIRSELQTELKNLLSSDIVKGKVSVQRAYADWRRYPQYIVPLAESSIDMIMATAYGSAKKNATDIRLAVDAMELVFTRPEIGTFILLSGDSDFASLVTKLKEYGKYVIGVGIRESSSDLLVMNCDEYYSYNALAGLVKTGEEEVVKRDPWDLVSEAIARMKRNGDVMRADRLKQVMQQMDSSFDEKNLGMSKFSRFVSEAAHRNLLILTKLENGQFEVAPPIGAAGAGSQATSLPAGQEAESGDRARRGRRGGRGRDRERERDGKGPREPRVPATATARVITSDEATADSRGPAPAIVRAAPQAKGDGDGGIGTSGLRLTREEAFNLVRRAVSAGGGASVRASQVRSTARELLGRDSESLSERNFLRILQDAHDADIVDLRRRGSDYEVAPAAAAAPLSDQLAAAEPAPVAATAAPAPMGMGARGGGSARRGRGAIGARVGAPPAHLLSVGVVETGFGAPTPGAPISSAASANAPVFDEPSITAEIPSIGEDALSDDAPKARATRKRARPTKPARGRKSASADDEKPAPRRAARKTRSKSSAE